MRFLCAISPVKMPRFSSFPAKMQPARKPRNTPLRGGADDTPSLTEGPEIMKIVNAMTGSLLLAVAPLAANAEDMSYSYVEAGWVNTDFDDINESADGPGVRGSVGFAENFFAFAEYVSQEVEFLGVDVDVDQIAVGL